MVMSINYWNSKIVCQCNERIDRNKTWQALFLKAILYLDLMRLRATVISLLKFSNLQHSAALYISIGFL